MSGADPLDETASRFREALGRAPTVLAEAPGRVEFIGNHLDYNGGPVAGAPIGRFIRVAAAPRADGLLVLRSEGEVPAELPVTSLAPTGGWTDYPAGVLAGLLGAGVLLRGGADLCFTSDLPRGAGLSSSAALEVATGRALLALAGVEMGAVDLAVLCRRAENTFVGMPCGILDQGVIAYGKAGSIVAIDCAELAFSLAPVPAGASLWLFPSGTGHRLTEGLYAERHAQCAAAFEVLRQANPGLRHLAGATPGEVEAAAPRLDPAAHRRAVHVVSETRRVRECLRLLAAGDLRGAGALLTASHRSSSEWFENSNEELDTLVGLLAEAEGVLGARLTGGGFGGAVLALAGEDFDGEAARGVAAAYQRRTGLECACFPTGTGEVRVRGTD